MPRGIVLDDLSTPGSVGQTNPMPVGTDYTMAIEYSGDNPVYIGEAKAGTAKSAAGWRIKKLIWDGSGNLTDIQWADGVKTFTKVWNNRTSYSYS